MELESSLGSTLPEILESLRVHGISLETSLVPPETLYHLIEALYRIDTGLETIPCEVKILSILILECHQSKSSRYNCFRYF